MSENWQEFTITKTKAKDFETCRSALDPALYRVENDTSIHVKLRWELLVLFGTRTQLASYDKFRTTFVDGLLKKYCGPLVDCDTSIIGAGEKCCKEESFSAASSSNSWRTA